METGDRIGGARILGQAGKGAMGVVYRAHQEAFDRTVAVKVVAAHLSSDPEFRARFEREARAAGALNHPHIVGVYDAGEDDGRLFLTMQYVEGEDLSSMLRRHGPMPPADAVEVVGQIASALDAAHARRLVHRDVKPANIMVTRRGPGWHAYLTDFGITTQLGEAGLTQTGVALGTLDYMAPEQLVGDPYDHRADVYALGAVLFQALTGRVPFPRDTDAARIYAHLNAEVPDLAELVSGSHPKEVVSALSVVARRAMAKRPDRRVSSAGEVAAAARAALQGQSTTKAPRAEAYTPADSGAGSGRPGRRALLLGGVGALAIGGGAAYAIANMGEGEGGDPKVTPAPELGLPDDVPAAKPSASLSKEFSVGKEPRGMAMSNNLVWVNNRGDRTLTRIDLFDGTQQDVGVGGVPHDFALRDRTLWVAVVPATGALFLQEVDAASGELGESVDLPIDEVASVRLVKDGPIWVSSAQELVRFDPQTRTTGEPIRMDAEFVVSSVSAEALVLVDRDKSTMRRLDSESGKALGSEVPLLDGAIGVAQIGTRTYVGGVKTGWGELVGDKMPTASEMTLKDHFVAVDPDQESVWAVDLSASELRRVTPTLSGPIGAPVADQVADQNTYLAGNDERLAIMNAADRTVRLFDVTPLRKK